MTLLPKGRPTRREVVSGGLAWALLELFAGCGGKPPPPPIAPPAEALPPLRIGALSELLPLAHLRWLILARPREIAAVPWLIPPIATVVPEDNLTRFSARAGMDLRQIPEAIVACYDAPPARSEGASPVEGEAPSVANETIAYAVRHAGDPLRIERLFRERLTSHEHRVVERPDLVRTSGRIGSGSHALATLGRDVVVYQQGGSAARGPARIASLYATGKLKRSPTLLAEDPLRALAKRFGGAPVRGFALGPFDGELARGARGLLAGATAIGAAARPSAREGIALVVAVAGDFSKSGEAASKELATAWRDLAEGSFGHLLGFDQPVEPPLSTHGPDAVTVAVELDPRHLATGLRRATGASIEEIMR